MLQPESVCLLQYEIGKYYTFWRGGKTPPTKIKQRNSNPPKQTTKTPKTFEMDKLFQKPRS